MNWREGCVKVHAMLRIEENEESVHREKRRRHYALLTCTTTSRVVLRFCDSVLYTLRLPPRDRVTVVWVLQEAVIIPVMVFHDLHIISIGELAVVPVAVGVKDCR